MSWERYRIDNYFKNELRFWKSMRAVYTGEKTQSKVLESLKERYKEEFILKMAEKRFNSMVSIIKLFKDEYIQEIIDKVNGKSKIELKDLNFKEIKALFNPFGWVEVAIIIAVIVIVILAEKYDNNGEGEDDAVIVTVETEALQALVAEEKFFDCDQISDLSYSAWATYLLMCKNLNNNDEYILALICSDCANLKALVESFNYDYGLIIPEDTTFLGAFFFAAQLGTCEIPY